MDLIELRWYLYTEASYVSSSLHYGEDLQCCTFVLLPASLYVWISSYGAAILYEAPSGPLTKWGPGKIAPVAPPSVALILTVFKLLSSELST